MAYEHREGQGSLFPNRKKEPGSKQPDFRGDAMLNGQLMEVAAWSKEGAKGSFLSLSIKPKEEREQPAVREEPRRHSPDRISSGPAPRRSQDFDDDVPFLPEFR